MKPPKLCKGSRLAVKNLMPHTTEATMMTGKHKGEDIFRQRAMIPDVLPLQFRLL